DTWLGQVVLIRPISFTFLTIAVVALAVTVLGFLFWGEYTRKAKVSGYIVPSQGLIKIASQQNGLIVDLRVKEGQQVAQGEILAVLNAERATANGGAQAETGKQLGVRRELLVQDREKISALYEQQTRALRERIAGVRAELGQVQQGLTLQQERVRITELMLDKQRRLHAEKFISDLALQQKEQERLADLGALENLKRSRTALQRDLASLESDLKSLPMKEQNELSTVSRNLALLEQDSIENESRRETYLTAPQAGTVTAIFADRGKLAVAGQPLLNLIPGGAKMQADVYVPSRAAGFIRVGSKALLQYQAYPYQKFGSHEGRIAKISRTAVASNELPFPAQQNELFYVATVELMKQSVTAYGKEEHLQSGMLVDASILLDRRTLLEWVFEPLYSISGRWGA
ncbi:MAG: HlyD family efflux transporter periplasmic adaptor subunit, partial [Betaproteobacteria bacterium]|nr:HlyD family efflux transporter periplasmic adaptor subunit [Betaproteobacteria bacterium]